MAVIRELAKRNDLPGHLIAGEIGESDTVKSLGIDSLGGVFLIERLEEMTGVQMPDDFVEPSLSLGEIAERLNRTISEQS